MKTSLIITTYNRPDALYLVLKSIEIQTVLPDEVIIADDGSDNKTKDTIKKFSKSSNLNLIHSWQPDEGFRLARSRNNALSVSTGDYIIIIDGDTILDKNFIYDHIVTSRPDCFISGSRVLLDEHATKKIIDTQHFAINLSSEGLKNKSKALRFPILRNLLSFSHNRIKGIRGCNMSFYRKDCFEINGFNNDFEGWGREDTEFIVRMFKKGVKRKNLKFGGIQYHLWHGIEVDKSLKRNDEILKKTYESNNFFCQNGLSNL